MARKLSGSARRELVAAVRARYVASAPSVKRTILREFAAITGYHRKSAIRILNGSGSEIAPAIHRARPRIYDEAFCSTLVVLWEASDRVCGKRLRALLPFLVPALERHGHLVIEPMARTKLLGVSAAYDRSTTDGSARVMRSATGSPWTDGLEAERADSYLCRLELAGAGFLGD